MLDLLRDPAWQVVGLAISVAVALWIYRSQRTRRELSFGVLSARVLITVHNSLSSRVSVTLDGRPVRNASLVVFALKNSGNLPIRPIDFQRPVYFRLSQGTSLLSAEIVRRSPPNLEALLVAEDASISLTPLLLNPQEYVVIQALIAGSDHSVFCDARVEGVSTLAVLKRGAQAERKSFTQRVGVIVLSFPLVAGIAWFVVSLADAVLGTKLVELLTINGSLAFGVILVALVASVLDEFSAAVKTRVWRVGSRTIDDA